DTTVSRYLITVVVIVLLTLVVASQFRSPADRVSGIIETDEIRIGSRIGGRVASVAVAEGARVAKGQLLVELEPYDLNEQERAALAEAAGRKADYEKMAAGFRPEEIGQAAARVEQLKANLELLETGPRPQEIEAAGARVKLAEAQLDLATRNHDRVRRLVESNATSREELDRANEQLRVAAAQQVVAQQELDALMDGTRKEDIAKAKAQLKEAELALQLATNGYRSEDIAQGKAAWEAAEAQVATVRARKEELKIISPMDGVIVALDLQKGDLVAPNAPVLSLVDAQRLWVRAYLPENRLDISLGDTLDVTVDSYPDTFHGKVTFISRQGEFTPSNAQTPEERSKQMFRIKVTLTDGTDKLWPGMAADVWLAPRDGQSILPQTVSP
ncbi:MAG: efflux RND transporter periplasmic adaptor subunit, partial [Planctomycetales bacterium]|nr:efflux RND transporter periplasmic adaptor subunit [Planctomycetales bacterium]